MAQKWRGKLSTVGRSYSSPIIGKLLAGRYRFFDIVLSIGNSSYSALIAGTTSIAIESEDGSTDDDFAGRYESLSRQPTQSKTRNDNLT